MTAATVPAAAPVPAPHVRPLLLQLARAEARRLVRHPIVLIGLVLSLAESLGAALTPALHGGQIRFVLVSGAGHWPLAIGTLLAANVVALRSRRHGTAELEDTTVTSEATRTLALLAGAVTATAALAIALVGANVAVLSAWEGITLHVTDGTVTRTPHVAELLQGPLVVALLTVAGVAVARWLPTRVVGPLLLVPAVIGFFHSTWRFDGLAWRFSPLMAHEETAGWVQVTPGSGYSILAGFDTAALAWHLLYVAGLTVVLATAAVARTHRSPRVGWVGAAGAAAAAVGGALQVIAG